MCPFWWYFSIVCVYIILFPSMVTLKVSHWLLALVTPNEHLHLQQAAH